MSSAVPHALMLELERRFGPLMRDIADYRSSHGYDSANTNTRRMLWEITRVIDSMPDDPAAIGWLQSAGPDDTAPVIRGYYQLCSALADPQPEADAICLARLSIAAPTFRLASCRFAEWWFDKAQIPRHRDGPNRPRLTIPPPPSAQARS